MVFEVITNKDQDSDENSTESDSKPETDVLRIEAHRVIIAARCDWFRRALLSGNQLFVHGKYVFDVHASAFQVCRRI